MSCCASGVGSKPGRTSGFRRAEKALELLGEDESREAHLLRADIYWTRQEWAQAAAALARAYRPARRWARVALDDPDRRYLVTWA